MRDDLIANVDRGFEAQVLRHVDRAGDLGSDQGGKKAAHEHPVNDGGPKPGLLCKLFVEVDRVVIPGDFRETLHVGLFERASQGRKLADFERRPGRAKRSTNVRSTATKISNKRPPLGANETV